MPSELWSVLMTTPITPSLSPTNEWHFDWRLSPTSLVSCFFLFFFLFESAENKERAVKEKTSREESLSVCRLLSDAASEHHPSWVTSDCGNLFGCRAVLKERLQHQPWPRSVHYVPPLKSPARVPWCQPHVSSCPQPVPGLRPLHSS